MALGDRARIPTPRAHSSGAHGIASNWSEGHTIKEIKLFGPEYRRLLLSFDDDGSLEFHDMVDSSSVIARGGAF
jgi:hypothetical protein